MSKHHESDNYLPRTATLLRKILGVYYRSNLRGRTLLTLLLAPRLKGLQALSLQIADWPPVYMDMRYLNAHFWAAGTPFESSLCEVNKQAVIRRFAKPGNLVFDIGASLGLHAVLLSQLVGPRGRVRAFEPNVEVLPLLERTINGLGNTDIFARALSDQNGESTVIRL